VVTMLIDGLTVDVSNADTAKATIATILAARDGALSKVATLETQVATLTTDKATADAKVTTLEQQLVDSKPTTAQLLDAAKSYAITVGKAKALSVKVTDAMDEAGIMKAVVSAKLGDKAKDWTDAQVAASFNTLTADLKVTDADPLAAAIVTNVTATDGINPDADREKRKAALRDGWKQPAANAA
jgi:hypothetical protein